MGERIKISVLMPVYNAESTVKAAIWSILNQGFADFELVIYLDGCTDRSEDIINGISDSRIRILKAEENGGIVHARNKLVAAANGEFIAWLDADDIALPDRLAIQYEYLTVHPEVVLLGGWAELRGNRNKVKKIRWTAGKNYPEAWMFLRNPFVQSSLMIRNRSGLVHYEPDYEYLEDYKFCSQFAGKGAVAVYPGYLVSYLEDSEKSRIDKYRKYDFVGKLERIMADNFAKLGLKPGKNELSLIRDFLRNSGKLKWHDYKTVYQFLLKSREANNRIGLFDRNAFRGVVAYQLLRLAKASPKMILRVVGHFITAPLDLFYSWDARIKYLK